ncbi:class I glutamine amidotransferase-like protein [Athelia psychrophila]|uniref:Class I glutamine amidotransferase-like protein n=1 Tax=Athelia psychrophila TaxID=1759441 RepID=A0A166KXA0_9AGAM|nr:class I glutamine amidotransferase-like protein [Fibularhizoctonia sp. CBS 109695]
MPTLLRLAVCLFPAVTALDYQGPMEMLGFLSPQNLEKSVGEFPTEPSYSIEADYLSHTMDPVAPMSGPHVVPTGSYSTTEKQYDIILVPGGPGARPDAVPRELLAFIKRQAPGLKYILSVCTGSWILAGAGVLDGKRATSNKSVFKELKEATAHLQITWVPKARWVVDDNNKLWTSSGVTAGQDMANAFLGHLVGKEHAEIIRNIVELSVKQIDNDEFAEHYGLVA